MSSITLDTIGNQIANVPFNATGTLTINSVITVRTDGNVTQNVGLSAMTHAFSATMTLPAGTHNIGFTDTATGSVASEIITVTEPTAGWKFITPGNGSFVIGIDNYSLTSGGAAQKNGADIPGGHGTAMMALLGGNPYGLDAGGSGWWQWNGSTWTAAVLSSGSASVTDDTGFLMLSKMAVTMTAGQQIAFNGVTDAITAGVTYIAVYNSVVLQKNNLGNWYTGMSGSWTGPFTTDPRQSGGGGGGGGTGAFQVSGGRLLGPDGNPFRVRGLAVPFLNWPGNANIVADHAIGTDMKLTQCFPGINTVRLVCFQDITQCGIATLAAIQPYVNRMTAAGIFVFLDPHIYPNTLSGSDLTTVCNRMAEYAAGFKNNPLVGFQTQNEPGSAPDAEVTAIINAIRGTGNNGLISMCVDPRNMGLQIKADYTGFHNVLFDFHFYGWTQNYSTDQGVNDAALQGFINQANGYVNVDGQILVMIGEFGAAGFIGDSSNGSWDAWGSWQDNNWAQVKSSVYRNQASVGYIEWFWNTPEMMFPNGNAIDMVLQPSYTGALTANGQALHDAIAAGL